MTHRTKRKITALFLSVLLLTLSVLSPAAYALEPEGKTEQGEAALASEATPISEDAGVASARQREVPNEQTPRVRLYIEGEELDAESYLINDTTYVPLRAFFDMTEKDAAISWQDGTAQVETKELTLTAQQNSEVLEVNGRILYNSNPIKNIDSRIYVPARSLAKVYGYDVEWEGETRSVYYSGERRVIADGESYYNRNDLYWLSRIIQAESGGEPLDGKIAVGNVILNRTRRSDYPDTIYGVIFDKKHGTQFSPTASGTIYNTPSADSIRAAKICLEGFSFDEEMIFFLNPKIATNFWIVQTRKYVMTIGNHDFYC